MREISSYLEEHCPVSDPTHRVVALGDLDLIAIEEVRVYTKFVKTDPEGGLSERNCDSIIDFLNQS